MWIPEHCEWGPRCGWEHPQEKNTTTKQTTNHTKQQRGTQNKKSKNSKVPNTTYDVMQELIPTDNQTPEACTKQRDFFFSR